MWAAVLIGIAEVALVGWGLNALLGGGKPTRTTRRYKNVFGNWVTDVSYHDTGRRVKHVKGRSLFGDKVTRTYEVQKGKKKCFRCGTMVTPNSNGRYRCCGRSFG